MYDYELTKEALERFRAHVISQARRNLTREGKTASNKLYEGLTSDIKTSPNSIQVLFNMPYYGAFVDEGVKGANPNYNHGFKNAEKLSYQKAPDSQYKFGTGSGPSGGLRKGLKDWIRTKGIKGRIKKGSPGAGRFITNKTLIFLLSRSIYSQGITPTKFFSNPFNSAFANLPDELADNFGLDLVDLFDDTMNEVLKDYKKN